MSENALALRNIAVIGAGVSGVAAGIHLKRAGLRATIFERNSRAGGVWVYNENIAIDAAYPSVHPSIGDSPDWDRIRSRFQNGRDSPMEDSTQDPDGGKASFIDQRNAFAPPGPCYVSLKNNVSTIEMEMSCQAWRPGTNEFVPHYVLADYIQDAARSNEVLEDVQFDTRVDRVGKVGSSWEVEVSRLSRPAESETMQFDAVVVASGHYNACAVPSIVGLSDWKQAFPDAVQHSKLYRSAERFKDQTVLLIGGGVSSMDIAKDLSGVASLVVQSTRNGPYDLPSHLLPQNAIRVGPIRSFDLQHPTDGRSKLREAGSVRLASGGTICGIDHVIVCTGYHMSFPYMRQYHADEVTPENADDTVLVTDGQQVHNLHKDIWYIPDPTLAFIGVPYHVATFSAFEFQAIALAAVFSGEVPLAPEKDRRQEYQERLRRKGAGRTFHSLKADGQEIAYVMELVDMVNRCRQPQVSRMLAHSERWHEAYARRLQRRDRIFAVPVELEELKLDDIVVGC